MERSAKKKEYREEWQELLFKWLPQRAVTG